MRIRVNSHCRWRDMTKREQFIQWLADAHAMEVGIVTTLEKHIADAKGLPKVRAALTRHLRETRRHATEMKKALASLGGSHPIVKEGVSKLANLAAGLVTTMARDTIVKNAIADFATEHFEMACYNSLIETATVLGERKIAATCRIILKEEKAMAASLDSLFKGVNNTYLATLEDEDADDKETRRAKSRKLAPRRRKAAR
jgi:ferritin-like metal-binding protein YciE